MAIYYEYKIAAGFNNAGGLQFIQAITPTNDKPFVPPRAYSTWSDGILRVRADFSRYVTGKISFTWPFDKLTVAQYQYLVTTYCTDDNGYSGPVTVRTRNRGGGFANYNAVLVVPALPELDRKYLNYRNVVITFNDAVAI